jgi:hypothetical protein
MEHSPPSSSKESATPAKDIPSVFQPERALLISSVMELDLVKDAASPV